MNHLLSALISLALATTLQAQTTTSLPDKPEVVLVQGGSFTMGSTVEENETPHGVTLSSYSIGKYPVTVGQYKKYCAATGTYMPAAPAWGWNDRQPMVNVNYNDAVAYCNWLGEQFGGDWRLPTEAQWEFAARGGKNSGNYTYSGSDDLDEVAWYEDNAGGKTQAVGRKKPNELGIYDMSGNVMEWCRDWAGKYMATAQTNPKGAASGSRRVFRGGSWGSEVPHCRVADRSFIAPDKSDINLGFRVVLYPKMQVQTTISLPDKPEVVLVQGGSFTMGSMVETDETPHSVTLSSYSIGKYPVTVGQYKKYCAATGTEMPFEEPDWGWNDQHPMVLVNYNDAVAYCKWLGKKFGGDWRLPTEAQWEFAARGGNKSGNYTYIGRDDPDEVAWYADNAGGKPQTVGRKKPNELGIYDMSGNVWEWCKDWYGEYSASAQTNPQGAASGTKRVIRGGSWSSAAPNCRAAYRSNFSPAFRNSFYGFRVVLSR